MVVLYSPMNDSNIAGTNYALQCDIVNVAPVQNLIVNWYRDNHLVKTDFFNETKSKLPVNESSSYEFITNKEDDGAEIRCEAFLDFGPEGPTTPAVWQTHIISVQCRFPFFFFLFFLRMITSIDLSRIDSLSNVVKLKASCKKLKIEIAKS